MPYGCVTINKANLADLPRCECNLNMENPCSGETDCINRMLMYECNPAVCQAGDRCCNQRFQRRAYPESRIVKTESRGWALITLADIKKVCSAVRN